jgi:hypothetical protein
MLLNKLALCTTRCVSSLLCRVTFCIVSPYRLQISAVQSQPFHNNRSLYPPHWRERQNNTLLKKFHVCQHLQSKSGKSPNLANLVVTVEVTSSTLVPPIFRQIWCCTSLPNRISSRILLNDLSRILQPNVLFFFYEFFGYTVLAADHRFPPHNFQRQVAREIDTLIAIESAYCSRYLAIVSAVSSLNQRTSADYSVCLGLLRFVLRSQVYFFTICP